MAIHSEFTGDALHVIGVTSAVDPGAIGAEKIWIDSSTTPRTIKQRNATNDGWVTLGSAGSGDMLKATYDTNNDGKVNAADAADAVPWSGVSSKPSAFPPESHTHDDRYFTETEMGATTDSASGADKIGATAIAGLTGATVQTLLEALKNAIPNAPLPFGSDNVPPTVNEDAGDGFMVGSPWFDWQADQAYVCLDNTIGAAIWKKITVTGSDIKLDDLATPDDNTDLNATTAHHGLLPKLPGGATKYLGGDGNYYDLPISLSAFLTDVASDIGGYKALNTTRPTGAEATVATACASADTVVASFALSANAFDFVSNQVLHVHLHLAKTAGTKSVNCYIKVFHRTAGGTETQMGVSDTHSTIAGSKTDYEFHAGIADTSFADTDRFVLKVYGTPAGSGTTPTLTVYYQGTNESRVELGANPTAAGYTNLTQFVSQTAWRVFYSDGSGDVQELALGADGTVLTSTGASSAPAFEAVGGGGSTKHGITIRAGSFDYDYTPAASIDRLDGTNVKWQRMRFDDTTEEFVNGAMVIPANLDTAGTVTLRIVGLAVTPASSKNVQFKFYHNAHSNDEAADTTFSSVSSGDKAISGTSGDVDVFSWTETVSNLGWAASDWLDFKLSRIDASSNDLSGDYGVYALEIVFPVSG